MVKKLSINTPLFTITSNGLQNESNWLPQIINCDKVFTIFPVDSLNADILGDLLLSKNLHSVDNLFVDGITFTVMFSVFEAE
jgi:hypothetical protein